MRHHQRNQFYLLAIWATSLLGIANAQENPAHSPVKPTAEVLGYEYEFAAMGTKVQLKCFHENKETVQKAFERAEVLALELAGTLTDYDPRSETRQLSILAAQESTAVSETLWQVLLVSDEWHQLSEGALDCSLGKLTQLWRKYRRTTRHPPPEEIAGAKAACGWQHVQLDRKNRSVRFLRDDLQLDFGAIGKGYVADKVFAVLTEHQIQCALVNISGNMRLGAPPPGRDGWRIEIAPLTQDGLPLRQLQLADTAIATSGDLWQFTVMDGVRRSHILDPKTGIGVAGPICATAITDTATNADALATIACVVGFEKAVEIARHSPGTELLMADRISADAPIKVQQTPGLQPKN